MFTVTSVAIFSLMRNKVSVTIMFYPARCGFSCESVIIGAIISPYYENVTNEGQAIC